MKIYNLFFLIIIIFSVSVKASVTKVEISNKYKEIFSNNILSSQDVKNYINIFNLQEACEWKKANKYIFLVKNKILIGHVLAQRYLHPRCYKSKFIELTYWLKKSNDHPQAKRIYRLAIKRMPEGYRSPSKPIKPIGIKKDNIDSLVKTKKYKSNKKLSKNQRLEKQKLLNAIKSRVNKGWPTGALKLLNQRDVNILLDQVEIDMQKELIAKGYFLANKNELAIKYSSEALEKSFMYVPYAGWTAGLAAWRLEKYDLAAEFFKNFSISLRDDVWHQASGAFWAARAYSKLNRYDEINFWLNRASKNPNSFYGLLASEILGIKETINWNEKIDISSQKVDLFQLPSGMRVQALIQIGLPVQIEAEIVHMNTVINKNIAIASLDLAQHFNLAYTQLKIVNTLLKYGVQMPARFNYPVPIWEPKNGFTLEPELIYAFMHQESLFNKNAQSYRGAMGLMQIMPSTAKYISSDKQVKRNNSNILKNPEINLAVGQEYIEYLLKLKSVNNNLIFLTAAYNGGPGNLQKWQEKINYLDDPLFFMESIPSRETRWFIEKVLTKYWIYKNKSGLESQSLILLASGKNPIY